MIELKGEDFKVEGSSRWCGSEDSLLEDENFQNLKTVYEHLKDKGFCHVHVKGGDYDGSIAKFTLDEEDIGDLYKLTISYEKFYNLKYAYNGKLSWKGRRNNPKFTLMSTTCDVLLDYEGEEVFSRFDLKSEAKKLLEKPVEDIEGNNLSEGDRVLYMNLRYGQGGVLCHGTVRSFKAHARDGYVSVIIEKDKCTGEKSECRQPHNQVYKKQ